MPHSLLPQFIESRPLAALKSDQTAPGGGEHTMADALRSHAAVLGSADLLAHILRDLLGPAAGEPLSQRSATASTTRPLVRPPSTASCASLQGHAHTFSSLHSVLSTASMPWRACHVTTGSRSLLGCFQKLMPSCVHSPPKSLTLPAPAAALGPPPAAACPQPPAAVLPPCAARWAAAVQLGKAR